MPLRQIEKNSERVIKEEKNKSKVWSRTLKVLLILVVTLILLASGTLAYVNIKKNEIGKELISQANTFFLGEINVGEIEVESIWTYPEININLKEIEIYDVNTKTASAKLTAEWGVDYFHLSKVNDQWKIVNVIWQSMPKIDK